ncbi:selenocysteine-specific elongation factor-like [Ruditapes philippinarum]|uniref:selenocysteine-specific elongation factor-like n=1 Tax=Ruditapes philippinarum TaxID=129788 RepID=UPI00295BE577|nr:selenocysteine-specific elongation factor-like [Ruditapes philippinarum]
MAAPMFNFNVGVLGHVDSGKTSLSKALSTTASTASFDKNPQSKERGITLDLGFSSFQVDLPTHLSNEVGQGVVQYTLVDCPGHASLIKTIIGGAQIIDLMLLVVDVVKGLQTQTAECLVIGEITCNKMIVVLNKADLLPPDKKDTMIDKMKKKMLKTLENTRFAGAPIVAVAAKPGGPESPETESLGLQDLIDTLKTNTYIPQRDVKGPFIFSVDHCFSIRGQGTVMTGTALSGSVSVNDTIEIPAMKVTKKVKSMQMFRKPVEKVVQGDRAGICVTQFDPKLLERGTICTPGALPTIEAAVISVQKIPYYKGSITSKAKFHITTGHDTVMGRLTFFGLYDDTTDRRSLEKQTAQIKVSDEDSLDLSKEYLYQDELISNSSKGKGDSAEGGEIKKLPVKQYALVQFEKPMTCQNSALVIGSKLDTDIHANVCRIAFHGKLLLGMTDPKYSETILPKIKAYKTKVKEGLVERVMDEYTVIGKNMFKKETNIATFTGLKITLSTGEAGMIEGGFGQSGKIKIRIPGGLPPEIVKRYAGGKKKSKGKGSEESANQDEDVSDKEPIKIFLTFKRYIYDPEKKMKQT